ncbi:MAG TPA: disulfide bond formation protein B [Rhizomicrobium sp.]|nr:disulfide bond formation protein B [Rhizomicrobium sp.]
MRSNRVAQILGTIALALILGALGFQYIAHFPPCEMCHWQRWPLIAAAVVGILGGSFMQGNARGIALLTVLLVAISGAIGFYQAGVEWHFFPGPTACTGTFHAFHGLDDLNKPGEVRCDVAAWRFMMISLAGWNAIISLGSALTGLTMLLRKK